MKYERTLTTKYKEGVKMEKEAIEREELRKRLMNKERRKSDIYESFYVKLKNGEKVRIYRIEDFNDDVLIVHSRIYADEILDSEEDYEEYSVNCCGYIIYRQTGKAVGHDHQPFRRKFIYFKDIEEVGMIFLGM